MSEPFVAAVVQMRSTTDREENRRAAERLVRQAAGLGADVIALPEMWPFIGDGTQPRDEGESLDGPTVGFVRELAAELGVTLFGGTFAERNEAGRKVFNTGFVAGPTGDLLASYRKIHLFDIDAPGGALLKESDTFAAGDRAVLVPTVHGLFGLTTCYDLRFPALYQSLSEAGAQFVLVPSAFTAHTGKDHWEVLLRARAIEQQLYVLAPNQAGWHNPRRQSHGHSMIVDPWGLVVARASDGEGVALAQVDPGRVAAVRRQLPCGEHRREFTPPQIP